MVAYLEYVQVLSETFEVFELVHVPREQNTRADLLAKLASSGKGGRQSDMIPITWYGYDMNMLWIQQELEYD